ncbi:MAG: hypothetical protein ABIJ08_04125, partial [Nanoarchaeota archaeon]
TQEHKSGGRGRVHGVTGVNYTQRGSKVTVAWLNTGDRSNKDNPECPCVGNIPFRVQERDDYLVPTLNSINGRAAVMVPNEVRDLPCISRLELWESAADVLDLVDPKQIVNFVKDVKILSQQIAPFTGAQVLLQNRETGDIVGQVGARTWVYESAIDMLDIHKMHLTQFVEGANGNRQQLAGKTVAEFLGIEELAEEMQEAQEELNVDNWFDM